MKGATFYGNILQAPRWAADYLTRETLEPWPALIDASQFVDFAGVPVVVTASASQGATSVTVSALTPSAYPATSLIASGNTLIPNGAVIDFGGAKFARLAADAKIGDTTLIVAALPTALTGNETASWQSYTQMKDIPSGTVCGRTYQERANAIPFGPAAIGDDEIFLLAFDLPNAASVNTGTFYRRNGRVKENYLPNYATTLAAPADEVETVTVTGSPTGGTYTLSVTNQSTTQTTGTIAYNAAASAVQTALAALSNVGANNVTVTGSAGGPYTVTFVGNLAGIPVGPLALGTNSLTGGTSPSVTVTRTTTGGSSTGFILGKLRSIYQCIIGVD